MGTSSNLATHLDGEMLSASTTVYPRGTPDTSLPAVTNLPLQLGGRYLLKYLDASKIGTLTGGTTIRQYVTPTAYAPEETISWLALPPGPGPRTWVLLLDPSQLSNVYGPRWIQFGGGIEYILDNGFPATAVANIAPGPPGSSAWELEVR